MRQDKYEQVKYVLEQSVMLDKSTFKKLQQTPGYSQVYKQYKQFGLIKTRNLEEEAIVIVYLLSKEEIDDDREYSL